MYVIALLTNTWGPWAPAVCVAVAFVGAIVIYAVGAPRSSNRPRGLRAFVGFERLWVRPFVVFAYAFGALACLALGVAAIVALGCTLDPSQLAIPIVWAVVVIAVAELLWRIVCELVMLFVRLCEDVHGWRMQANEKTAPIAGQDEVPTVGTVSSRPAEPAALPLHEETTAASWAPASGSGPEAAPIAGTPIQPPTASFAGPVSSGAAAPAAVLPVAPEPMVFAGAPSEAVLGDDGNLQPNEDPFALPVEELPTVFDAATYEAYAARGAFDVPPASDCGPSVAPAPESLGGWEAAPADEANAAASAPEVALGGYGYPAWNCACGTVGNTGAYCGQCGRPRPC